MSYCIEKSEKYVREFEKKYVFAPNGFGKTQFSLYLRDKLLKQGKSVGMYTRREVDDLVKISEDNIYIGQTAVLLKKLDDLRAIFSANNILSNPFETELRISSSKYYSASYFYKKNGFSQRTKLEKIIHHIVDNYDESAADYSESLLYRADVDLDYELYGKCVELTESALDEIEIVLSDDKIEMPQETIDAIEKIRDFISENSSNQCPVCGTSFASNSDLLQKVEEMLQKCISSDKNELLQRLAEAVIHIRRLLRKRKSVLLKEWFKKNKIDDNSRLSVLYGYIGFCNEFEKSFVKMLGKRKCYVDGEEFTLINLARTFVNLDADLKGTRKSINILGEEFKDFVVDELSSIMDFDKKNIKFQNSLDTIEILEDGITTKKKIGDYFSESQLKRISLVILRGYVLYFHYDYIILDDPVDSYDDYYLNVACQYIIDTLDMCTNTSWYLLTNSYNFLIYAAQTLGARHTPVSQKNFVVFNEHPDIVFSNKKIPPFVHTFSWRDVQLLNINEMILLSKYADDKTKVKAVKQTDFDTGSLPFLAMTVTMRNMRDIIHNNYPGITVGYACPVFSEFVSSEIENSFMHYNPKTSPTATLGRLYNVYEKILNPDNVNLKAYQFDKNPSVLEREKVVKTPFSLFKGNKLLNLLLFKILMVSYLKYYFEEKMINELKSHKIKTSGIVKERGLGPKLRAATVAAKGDARATNFVNCLSSIHKKFSGLINDFDHALNRMYPPYFSTSFVDMKRLYDAINSVTY